MTIQAKKKITVIHVILASQPKTPALTWLNTKSRRSRKLVLQVQTAATLLGVLGDTSTHRVEVEGWRVWWWAHYRRIQAV